VSEADRRPLCRWRRGAGVRDGGERREGEKGRKRYKREMILTYGGHLHMDATSAKPASKTTYGKKWTILRVK
jgi:hypothetical protein